MTSTLRARWVFPVERAPIQDGVVTIDYGRITEVGKHTCSTAVEDLGEVALLPGFVNAHTHLEFSHLRNPLGQSGMPLVEWIRLVIAERGRTNTDPSASIQLGLRESLACGITTLGDIATSAWGGTRWPTPDRLAFLEVIGFSRARATSALAALIEKIDAATEPLLAAGASSTQNAISVLTGNAMGISPHAPYTVSPDLLNRLVEVASRRGMPLAMHVAESRDELALLECGGGPFRELLEERSMWDPDVIPPNSRPGDYLQRLAAASRSLVIHGNYLTCDELAFVGENRDRMTLVYCPRTHAYFGHDRYPLESAFHQGVRIALGTDSLASNPDLNLLAEMAQLSTTFPQVDPFDTLQMGTLAGAEALGCADAVGSISPGKLANLVAVPLPGGIAAEPKEVLQAVYASAYAHFRVWLRGREVDRVATRT